MHFPFCKAKCGYCDFYSLPCRERIPAYEKALANSLVSFSRLVPDTTVETVYLGGGTPSLATPDGIKTIFASLRESFSVSEDAEITAEMNPESTNSENLSAFYGAGVNRISFGMQSASDEELATLGRLHRFCAVEGAVRLARKAGFENISLDLMYGLPGQSLSGVPLYASRHLLPEDEAVREMYLFASAYLQKQGFEHYEVSNAAKKGFRSRHNQVYWNGGDYLGIGPGAHSLVKGKRFFMQDGVEEFIAHPIKRFSEPEILTCEDLLTEYVMLSLRTKEGVSMERIFTLSDQKTVDFVKEKFTLWQKHGLCVPTQQGFALTPEGFFVSNRIIAELI